MQLDGIFVNDWGFEGQKVPSWIKLNEDFTEGMYFEINPANEDEGIYKIFVDLIDDNFQPLSSRFEFELQIIDSSKLNFWQKTDTEERQQDFVIEEQISVRVKAPD